MIWEKVEKKRATKNVDHIIFQAFLVSKSCIGEMHSPSLKSLVTHKVGLKSNPSISKQCLDRFCCHDITMAIYLRFQDEKSQIK
jgi:hypothetical protein